MFAFDNQKLTLHSKQENGNYLLMNEKGDFKSCREKDCKEAQLIEKLVDN